MKNFYKRINAFTLSEIMVTLAVLGVIAAVSVPAIMGNVPDNNKVMFKKAYASTEKAINNLINDDSLYPVTTNWTYLGVTHNCTDNTGATVPCGFHNVVDSSNNLYTNYKFCTLFTEQLNIAGEGICYPNYYPTCHGYFTTSDGVYWNVDSEVSDAITAASANTATATTAFPLDSSLYAARILIDVNGDKGPNCSADTYAPNLSFNLHGFAKPFDTTDDCPSPDRFVINVRYDGKLRVGCTSAIDTACTGVTDSIALSILSEPTNNVK